MFHTIKKFIHGDFNYIDVAADDIDYKVVLHGLPTFDLLGIEKKFTIVDCSQNFADQDTIHGISNSMIHCGIPGLLLSPDPAINNESIKYFPIFACHGVMSWNEQIEIDQLRPYVYSCLNRKPHTHRIINWFSLRDTPGGLWSMYNIDGAEVVANFSGASDLDRRWQQEKQHLATDCFNDLNCDHPAFTQSYINVVTETVMRDSVFVSEKTWKSVACGQFTLILGCMGAVSYLRNIGVDVFDDIIDHSYDLEPDWYKRIQLMQQSFQKLVASDVTELWLRTQQRREQNRTNFFKGEFVDSYVKEINDSISKAM